jgi:hypothetical protein
MYITCNICGNPNYWVDYGPTQCDACGTWNTQYGTNPYKKTCTNCLVTYNSFIMSGSSLCDLCSLKLNGYKEVYFDTESNNMNYDEDNTYKYSISFKRDSDNLTTVSPDQRNKSEEDLDKFFKDLVWDDQIDSITEAIDHTKEQQAKQIIILQKKLEEMLKKEGLIKKETIPSKIIEEPKKYKRVFEL